MFSRMKRQAKEEQEELALDMKILESLIEETKNEAVEQAMKKVHLTITQAIEDMT